jgi:Cu(I)/Ag(I) efflux system membrane fusion protein/cobalt-zinc-cadmium efflux system membrane fusion protein
VDDGNGSLVPTDIQLGARVGDLVVVMGGLRAHQRIVTSANFLIDSESQIQAAAGSSDASEAPAPQVAQKATEQLKIEFNTRPSPASKGNNQLSVTVSEANGSPCKGADVTATFFMQAMPAMGMPASRVSAHLNERRPGTYTGGVSLNYGGTWQLTITVKRNGTVVAVKSATTDVAGGM